MFSTIAAAQAESGDRSAAAATLQQALATANSIEDDPAKFSWALTRIAKAQASLGDRSTAGATLLQALAAAKTITEEAESRYVVFLEIAEAQAGIGDLSAAAVTFQEAVDATATATTDAKVHPYLLMNIANLRRQAGDLAGAARTLQQVRIMAESPSGDVDRNPVLSDVTSMQAGARFTDMRYPDRFNRALKAALTSLSGADLASGGRGASPRDAPAGDIDAALATTRTIADPRWRLLALEGIAAALVAAGDYPALEAITSEMLTSVTEVDGHAQGRTVLRLYDIVLVQLAAGEIEGALPVARTMQRAGLSASPLVAAAWVQAEMGDLASAKAILREALADRAPGKMDHGTPFVHLVALAQANIGDMAEALSTAGRIADARARAEALIAIATDKPPDFHAFLK